MRLLIFSMTYPPYIGGAEIAVVEILKRLPAVKAVVITARLEKKNSPVEELNGVKIVRVGRGHWSDKYLFPLLAYQEAKRQQQREGFDLMQAIMATYAGLAALVFKYKFSRIPYLLTLQSGDSAFFMWIRTWWFYPLYRQVYLKADYIQAISNYLISRARSYGYKGDCELVPNGVDYDLFAQASPADILTSLRQELGVREGEKVIITTSRLVYKNAIDQLILGFYEWQSKTKLPAKLIILGEGKDKKKLQKLVSLIGAEGLVIFVGQKDYQSLPSYLHLADVFVRPSRSEGMGNSFIEAMAAGVPVVATEVGGIPDFLEDRVTGLFCDKDNPYSIARAINDLILDHDLRAKVIAGGKERAKNYNWEKISAQMSTVYNKLSKRS